MLNVFSYIIGALIIIFALAIIGAILLQEGRRAGISGAISGAADTFLSKNKARTVNDKLSRFTKFGVALFFVLALAFGIVTYFA